MLLTGTERQFLPGDDGDCRAAWNTLHARMGDCHHGSKIMARPPSIRNFIGSLFSSWFVAMSGPLSVPLALAALFASDKTLQVILGLTAFVCLWAASYVI
jgi:hypothetical protein